MCRIIFTDLSPFRAMLVLGGQGGAKIFPTGGTEFFSARKSLTQLLKYQEFWKNVQGTNIGTSHTKELAFSTPGRVEEIK